MISETNNTGGLSTQISNKPLNDTMKENGKESPEMKGSEIKLIKECLKMDLNTKLNLWEFPMMLFNKVFNRESMDNRKHRK